MTREVTKTLYEWDLEEYDPSSGDIIDHNWHDKCPGIPTENNVRLVLIRDVAVGLHGDADSFSLRHRAWAYVDNGTLPEQFDSGDTVPQRFHKELAAITA